MHAREGRIEFCDGGQALDVIALKSAQGRDGSDECDKVFGGCECLMAEGELIQRGVLCDGGDVSMCELEGKQVRVDWVTRVADLPVTKTREKREKSGEDECEVVGFD